MSDREFDQQSPERQEAAVEAADAGRDPRMVAAMRRRQVHRKAARSESNPNVRIPEGSGSKLPTGVAADMGQKLGADLSDVRVHTGGDSEHAADQLGAKAFTVDKNVHFGRGQYSPDSKQGQHLLAHELAHVVQGEKGAVRQKNQVSQPHDPAEVEADQAADSVMAGRPASIGAAQGARVHLTRTDGNQPAGDKKEEPAPDGAAPAPEGATPGAEVGGGEKPGAEGGGKKPGAEGGDKKPGEPGDKAAEGGEAKPDGPGGGGAGFETLGSLAAALTPENASAVNGWAANPEICLSILKGPFEANWFKAKECLLMGGWPVAPGASAEKKPDHALSMKLMDGLVAMRSIECAKVQKRAESEIQAEVQKESQGVKGLDDPMGEAGVQGKLAKEGEVDNEPTEEGGKKKPGKQVEFKAPVGNQKRTSDIDTATGGMNTELAVALFNRLFKEMLEVPYESGTMFDYNVYAMDWIHNLDVKKGKAPGTGGQEKEVTTQITPGVEHKLEKPEDKKERNLVLEKASILHIRRYMNETEWGAYCKERLIKETDPGERLQLEQLLESVDQQHSEFLTQISTRSEKIQKEIDTALQGHESAWDEHKNQHFQDEAVKTRASNRIYEERLREVKSLRVQYQILKEGPQTPETAAQLAELAKQVTKALSEALFFANEVYASEGATIHVVLGMQGAAKKNKEQEDTGVKVDVPLTPEQYMQSFNENVGDVLKDFGHFHDRPPFAVYRAGKYMDRMCKAATALTPEAKDHPLFPKLTEISAKSVSVKESDKGDDPQECMTAFGDYNESAMETLKGQVIQFGADIPAQAQKAQAASKAVESGATPPPDAKAEEKPAAAAGATDAASANPQVAKAKEATTAVETLVPQLETTSKDVDKG